jgi:hypothetical protein
VGRLYPLLFLINLALLLFALIDCLSRDEFELRALPKVVWVLLILLFSPIGAIAYLIAGRPERAARRAGSWAPGSGFPERERPRPVAPDDDPAFLRGLADQRRQDEELLRRWEADLRRREESLRERENPPER